jgi:hypothetical protein
MVLLTAVLFQFSAILAEKTCGYELKSKVSIFSPTGKKSVFKVGIADTSQAQQKGLMFCDKLTEKTGLLFVFNSDSVHYFWMKNTKLELAIIYIDKNGKIVSIRKGEPYNEQMLSSIFPVRYVLEINWKESLKIKTGDKVVFGS